GTGEEDEGGTGYVTVLSTMIGLVMEV
ncbi:hypothetical protein A2U01_0109249, partial [Trifolium medium]|nr:hypothetical protein [Trifolium medium]